jgi:tRNA modification GTPase
MNHLEMSLLPLNSDTIAAISTPPGRGGIGIVRLSGPDAFRIAREIFKPKNRASSAKPFKLRYGHIVDDGNILDEALVSLMPAPKTYTTQNMAEINCHGGNACVRRVLELAIRRGARLALPGEFTKLAFLCGRIDLSQAEAVMSVIGAENDFALKSAADQLSGTLGNKIRSVKEEILSVQAAIEVAIDYPEEFDFAARSLKPKLIGVSGAIDKMIQSGVFSNMLAEGINMVIIGKPNVGKSSLLNAMLGRDRAIVAEQSGTTRDIVSDRLPLGDLLINIMDTAGIRETCDAIESMGVERGLLAAGDAHLIIWVIDGSSQMDDEDERVMEFVKKVIVDNGKLAICAVNKKDLPTVVNTRHLRSRLGMPCVRVSALANEGVDELKEEITRLFSVDNRDDDTLVTNMRHIDVLTRAKQALQSALQAIDNGLPDDFVSLDLGEAYHCLGEITGDTAGDDLIYRIFSTFCVGK